MAPSLPVISAADLEKYGYCPLSWWLSLADGEQAASPPPPPDAQAQLDAGRAAHDAAGQDLEEIRTGEAVVVESEQYILTFSSVAAGIAIFGFLLTFLGMEAWNFALIPMVISLFWLVVAAALFRLALQYFFRVRAHRARMGMAAGTGAVVYVGEGATIDEDPALFSHRLGLVGAPDTIIDREEYYIPVEIKTGRVPKGPLFSHILQLAAYCALVEEKYGRPPPFGLLRYGAGVEYEIEYNDDQRRLLEDKLAEMRAALASRDVHRNHSRPGKCAGCSRREGCPERLDRGPLLGSAPLR
ncbi:MAG TPA: PD-(D/E)XK nuclease family protein [Candidatus Thermoplasmatota archaeon]